MAGRPGSRFHARLSSARWARVRRAMLERAGYRCEACGRPGVLEVHHKRPLHKGGDAWAASNLAVLCRSCHVSKHKRPLSQAARAWRDLVAEIAKK